MSQMWPKYLQVGLKEMATKLKQNEILLFPEEFEDMPRSWCDNIRPKFDAKGKLVDKNDWAHEFGDFLMADI